MTRSAKEYLEGEKRKAIESARVIVRKAEDESRTLTDDEQGEIDGYASKAAEHATRLDEIENNEKMDKTLDDLEGKLEHEGEHKTDAKARDAGEALVKSEGYQLIKSRGGPPSGSFTTGAIEWAQAKAFGDIPSGGVLSLADTTAHGDYMTPDVVPGIHGRPEWPLRVADLFAQGTTAKSSVKYYVEDAETNGAAETNEGAEKPASSLTLDGVIEPVRKIATFMPVSEEFFEDEDVAMSFVNGRIPMMVRVREDQQLLTGNGTPPNISGILDRTISTATATGIGGDNVVDAVLAGMTEVEVAGGFPADAVIWNPVDAAKAKVLKADTSGTYQGQGPWTAPSNNPWGLREVRTTRIAEGTVLVGAFKTAAQLFRRGGLTMAVSNSHADWFRKDIIALRAETRLALCVYQPLAFCTVTLGS